MLGVLIVALVSSPQALAGPLSAEMTLQALPNGTLASGAGARLDGGRPFVSIEGRSYSEGFFTGRVTGGLDLFGESDTFSASAGLFLGTTGGWQEQPYVDPLAGPDASIGFELGVGVDLGRVFVRYRHVEGLRGQLAYRLAEDELRAGVELGDSLEVFGQAVRFDPGESAVAPAYGAGMRFRF